MLLFPSRSLPLFLSTHLVIGSEEATHEKRGSERKGIKRERKKGDETPLDVTSLLSQGNKSQVEWSRVSCPVKKSSIFYLVLLLAFHRFCYILEVDQYNSITEILTKKEPGSWEFNFSLTWSPRLKKKSSLWLVIFEAKVRKLMK